MISQMSCFLQISAALILITDTQIMPFVAQGKHAAQCTVIHPAITLFLAVEVTDLTL